ncbi:hypothetical protein XENOCAPTIV_003427 [Xenoophorus captivus]|uniref:Uncharacterized protein n=1 Tax=Xenoophorus captivus TaxID=1517983 RepID=A0ABV0QCL6_9TELE
MKKVIHIFRTNWFTCVCRPLRYHWNQTFTTYLIGNRRLHDDIDDSEQTKMKEIICLITTKVNGNQELPSSLQITETNVNTRDCFLSAALTDGAGKDKHFY